MVILKQVIEKLKEQQQSLESVEGKDEIVKHFKNTLVHIRHRQEVGSELNYAGLVF